MSFTSARSTTRARAAATTAAVVIAALVVTVAPAATAAAAPAGAAPAGAPTIPTAAGAPDTTTTAATTAAKGTLPVDAKVDPRLTASTKPQTAFIRTSGPGALAVDAKAKGGDLADKPQSAAATARVGAVRSTTNAIARSAKALDSSSRVVYTTAYTVPGVAINATPETFAALAKRSDVVSITPVVAKTVVEPKAAPAGASTPQNTTADILTSAIQVWNNTGHIGTGVNVAVIDTGIDYTHADFGGPGTRPAYLSALALTDAPAAGSYDPEKYLGGWDFAGPKYNADSASYYYDPYPAPDANPIDGPGGGHGSHVSGTIAGYGVDADGATVTGDPRTFAPEFLRSLSIGPGTAPGAGLYGLKVFGDDGGATELAGAALDWVGQALTEGTTINVVNMSLGTDYGAPDDPDNAKVDALIAQGVLPVIAQGNAGDLTDIGGSPGNATGALTVAAVNSGVGFADGLPVTAPADLAANSPYWGQLSVNYYFGWEEVVSGAVVQLTDPTNLDGCGAFSAADAAAVVGKIVWLDWDDDDVACGSAARFTNASDAGAIGVLLPSTHNVFEGGIAGNYSIPGMQLTADSTAALRPAAEAGTLHVELRNDLAGQGTVHDPALEDTIADFSSRGAHGSQRDIVKPDVSAPGVNVISAGSGGGSAPAIMSGTSMATPVTAGVAALAYESHPDWDVAAIKADLMNTASHDVSLGGMVLDNLRQGTGRIDAAQAVANQVTVTSKENGDLLTASFGAFEVGAPTTRTRTIQVTNRGTDAVTYSVGYTSRTAQPGVSVTLDRDAVTVPAGGSATMTLTLSISDPTQLRRVRNATQDAQNAGFDREFVAAESGLITLTPAPEALAATPAAAATPTAPTPPLRLAVFAAPKPVSATKAAAAVRFATATSTNATLTQTGTALNQGSGAENYSGTMVPLVYGASSPALTFPAGTAADTLAGADILQVGASSSAPLFADRSTGMLAIGVRTRGSQSNPGANTYPAVRIDIDGQFDFESWVTKLTGSDITATATVDLATGQQVALQTYNDALEPGAYVNTFDSTTSVLTVPLAGLGFTKNTTATKIIYQAVTYSRYAPGVLTTGDYTVDVAPKVSFDVYRPALWFSRGTTAGPALPDTVGGLAVRRAAPSTAKILMLHLAGANAAQAEVISQTTTPSITATKVAVSGTTRVGSTVKAVVSGWNTSGLTVTYRWLRDGKAISGATKSSYLLAAADKGRKISVKVSATKSGWNPWTGTSPAKVVSPGVLSAKTVTVTGTAKVGVTVRATVTGWSTTGVTVGYRWLRDGKAISGATKSTYKLVTADRKHKISVKVTGTKAGWTSWTKTSAARTVS